MDMVEKVARALCDGNWDAANFNETANGEDPEEQREYWREKARAAIEAMRTPTKAMRHAGFAADAFRTPMARMETDFEPKAVFEAMIDAALGGK